MMTHFLFGGTIPLRKYFNSEIYTLHLSDQGPICKLFMQSQIELLLFDATVIKVNKQMVDVSPEVAHLIQICITGSTVNQWDSDGKHMEAGGQKW